MNSKIFNTNLSTKCSTLFSKSVGAKQIRQLNIHEYQSQALMKKYGIKVPSGSVAATPDEAEKIAEALNTNDLIVKAQILAGGRGLGTFEGGLKGGVQLCHNPKEMKSFAEKMIGKKLMTKQTGAEGRTVSKILVAKRHFLRRESYFAILLDRESKGPVMIASSQGGVDIEKVAAENPQAIVKEKIDVTKGPQDQQTRNLAKALGYDEKLIPDLQATMNNLYKLFMEKDALMVEVNPLAETSENEVMCIDAKINFDDNSMFRQKDIAAMEDASQKDPREVEAAKADLNYIGLDGTIGCLVNGAGLAMATMDMIQLYGGSPANFLDVGGGATQQQVTSAIKILTNDPKVKVILINIFGGIMRCDVIALGVIQAVKELSLKIPLVVRLQGTNMTEAKRVLSDSGLRILTADDLDDAAQKSVKAAQIIHLAETANLNIKFELPL